MHGILRLCHLPIRQQKYFPGTLRQGTGLSPSLVAGSKWLVVPPPLGFRGRLAHPPVTQKGPKAIRPPGLGGNWADAEILGLFLF